MLFGNMGSVEGIMDQLIPQIEAIAKSPQPAFQHFLTEAVKDSVDFESVEQQTGLKDAKAEIIREALGEAHRKVISTKAAN